MVIKMKRQEIKIALLAILFCAGAWFFKPSYYQKNDGQIYAKSYKSDAVKTSVYDLAIQKEAKQNLEQLKADKSFSESNPLLVYNPFGSNTLSMYMYFNTKVNAQVSYTVHVDDVQIQDFTRVLNTTYKSEHEAQLLGLIPDQKNYITITLLYADGSQASYSYDYNAPALLGSEEIILDKSEGTSTQALSDGLYVILGNDSTKDDFMYYYDENGVIRGEIPIEEYRSHRLLFQNDKMYYSYDTNKLAEMDALGQVTNTYNLGDYELHHDYVFDDQGNIMILASDTTTDRIEDIIITLDLKTKNVTKLIDLADIFPEYKVTTTLPADEDKLDWIHINSLQYIGNNQIILSARETSTIIALSNIYTNPTISYLIGEESFWKDTPYAKYLLTKGNSFTTQGGQHTVSYVFDPSLPKDQYYLYMFNNNYGVSLTQPNYDWNSLGSDIVTKTQNKQKISKYYRYLINESTRTVTLVDSFDTPYSAYVSSAQEYESHYIINSGVKQSFLEYDENKELIASFKMKAETFIYRVYKYNFEGFYFNK